MNFDDLLRNQALYDVAGLITQTEARRLFRAAGDFVALVRRNLSGDK